MVVLTDRPAIDLAYARPQRPRLAAFADILTTSPELQTAYDGVLAAVSASPALSAGKSVLVTCAQRSKNRSPVAPMLAVTAALAGRKILLIDGNMRDPWLAAAAGLNDSVGLTEILDVSAEPTEAVHRIPLFPNARDSLVVNGVTAGRRPGSLLSAEIQQARARLQMLAEPYDLALIDAPPLLASCETAQLARLSDGALLVVEADITGRAEVSKAKSHLDQLGARFVGAVLDRG